MLDKVRFHTEVATYVDPGVRKLDNNRCITEADYQVLLLKSGNLTLSREAHFSQRGSVLLSLCGMCQHCKQRTLYFLYLQDSKS